TFVVLTFVPFDFVLVLTHLGDFDYCPDKNWGDFVTILTFLGILVHPTFWGICTCPDIWGICTVLKFGGICTVLTFGGYLYCPDIWG
ncbi:unnamed protein product, partial [Staurois parvus]